MTIVQHIIEKQDIHDQDYIAFKHFTDPHSTILDIGANFGYSATAIWRVGSQAAIASFEPIRGFAPILEEFGRRKNPASGPKKYEAYTLGISSEDGEAQFFTSVINGRIQSALTTADKNTSIEAYVKMFDYVNEYIGDIRSFKIFSFSSPITTIDKWMTAGKSNLNLNDIVAMKIDTEGYEGRVLVGASALLRTQKPLIMAECGHVIDLAVRTAFDHGYLFAERDGDKLRVSDQPTKRVNGFFVHPDKFSFYRLVCLM